MFYALLRSDGQKGCVFYALPQHVGAAGGCVFTLPRQTGGECGGVVKVQHVILIPFYGMCGNGDLAECAVEARASSPFLRLCRTRYGGMLRPKVWDKGKIICEKIFRGYVQNN